MTWRSIGEFAGDLQYWAAAEYSLADAADPDPAHLTPTAHGDVLSVQVAPAATGRHGVRNYEITYADGYYSPGRGDQISGRGGDGTEAEPTGSFSSLALAGKFLIYRVIVRAIVSQTSAPAHDHFRRVNQEWVRLANTRGVPPGWTYEHIPPGYGHHGDSVYTNLGTGQHFRGVHSGAGAVAWMLDHDYAELRERYSRGFPGEFATAG